MVVPGAKAVNCGAPVAPGWLALALGSNLGDREAHLGFARSRLRELGIPWSLAGPVEETAPLGPVPQGPYLNQVLAAPLGPGVPPPADVLALCLAIEAAAGRVRGARWGPRTLDIDIVLYGASVVDTPELVIPHPELVARPFVLQPLAALLPGVVHPRLGRTLAELAARV